MAQEDRTEVLTRSGGGPLRVALLGPLAVEFDGRQLGPSDFGGRKPKQVLEILLAHMGQPVPKDRIADLLWGEALPRDPMRTLEAYVSSIRQRLHADGSRSRRVLASEPGAYRVVLDDAEVDTWQFDDLVARADQASTGERCELRGRALDLIRGEVLADEPYAEWVRSLRDLYAERHMRVLLDSAEDHLVESRSDLALHYAEQVLMREPARERAHRIVIAAHYAAGDQDLALVAYERCREGLAEELGVRPLDETERLYLAVLNHEPLDGIVPRPRAWHPGVVTRPPATRFARCADTMVAWQAIGDGPLDVVLALGWFSHLEVGWEEPRYASFVERLARGRRLLLFDRRGVGMSDPAPADLTVEDQADDIAAVMDAAESARAVVFGISAGAPAGVALAARASDRVVGLILYSSFGRLLAAPDYPWGWSPEFLQLYQAGLDAAWTEGRGIELALPAAAGDQALREWTSRYLRLAVRPAVARAILDHASRTDVRDLLALVRAPTIVLHRRDEQWINPDNGRYVATNIPGARFVELPGTDYWPWIGDTDSVLREVDGFLGRVGAQSGSEGFPRVQARR